MQLSPGEYFTIVRQLPDPSDASVNYVQAVIRDAKTDAVIETVKLTDQGSRRFSKPWVVYSKRSDGFYIAITTTVYTDSLYTTKSTVYAEEMETYLVEQRNYHSGGGAGISYLRVQESVAAALKAAEKEPDAPIDVVGIVAQAITAAVQELKDHVSDAVETAKPEIPEVDLSPLVVSVSKVAKMLEEVQATLPDSFQNASQSLAEVLSAVYDTKNSLTEAKSAITASDGARAQSHNELVKTIQKGNTLSMQRMSAEDISRKIETLVRDALGKATTDEEPIESPYDLISKLRGDNP